LAILGGLARAALVQLAAAGAVAWLVRQHWSQHPRECRWACVLILLQGWMIVPFSLAIPWYEPETQACSARAAMDADLDSRGTAALPPAALRASPGGQAAEGHAGDSASVGSGRGQFLATSGRVGGLLLAAWLVGAAGMAWVKSVRYLRFCSTLPRLSCPREDWMAEWNEELGRHNLRRRLPLWVTRDLGPMLAWLPGGSAVLVPAELWNRLPSGARRAILRHELAHFRRGDPWKSLVARLLAVPQWFNPGAWWAVRMFDQCGERSCDQQAAASPAERLEFARALTELAGLRRPVHAVGACAHSHPLVCRVRCLLKSPDTEIHPMRKFALLAVAGTLFLAGAVRVELVAKAAEATKESTLEKASQLDQMGLKVHERVQEIKEKGKALNEKGEATYARLKELYTSGNLPEAARAQVAAVESGDEARQVEAVAKAKGLGDGGLIVLALAAGSQRESVRRKALESALALGSDGFVVIHHAFENLPDADRIFLAEEGLKDLTPERMLGIASIYERSSAEVRDAILKQAVQSKERMLLFALIGWRVKDNAAAVTKLIEKAATVEGDQGLLALYASAKTGQPCHRIAALKAAVARKQDGLTVVAAAFTEKDAEVRAQAVRTAKAIGGPVAEYAIQMALSDPDESLRKAAEKAIEEAKAAAASTRK
jgi:beta-lactamase regulating signal transducer with metallopeptidase domain